MTLEGKCFVGSVELLAWAKANGCPWDYNTKTPWHTPWRQFFSSVPGGRPFYRRYPNFYFSNAADDAYTTKRKEPTPSEAGGILRIALNHR